MENEQVQDSKNPMIYIVSGGVGASGEQVVHSVLAQFPQSDVRVVTVSSVRYKDQIAQTLAEAADQGALVVHTLVDAELRTYLSQQAAERDLPAVDLMGPLFEWLSGVLDIRPLGRPGLYRQLNKDYFERVDAIEYTMRHDDGQHPEGWPQAEIVLIGASRVGKTPLSLYLSVLGWKVANIPLVPGLTPSPQIEDLERGRVIGLTVTVTELMAHRQQRQRRLGAPGPSDYTDPTKIYAELDEIEKFFKRHRFATLDVSQKPIETSADEIVRLVTGRVRSPARQI